MLLLSVTVTVFLAIAAAALALVMVCCRRSYRYWTSSAMFTTLPQAVTGKTIILGPDLQILQVITLGPNLQILQVAYASRGVIARRSSPANHANTDGQEDPAMLTFLVHLATDPDPAEEFEINCKSVPATD